MLGSISLAVATPSFGFAQSAPEVFDSFPKKVLEERAKKKVQEEIVEVADEDAEIESGADESDAEIVTEVEADFEPEVEIEAEADIATGVEAVSEAPALAATVAAGTLGSSPMGIDMIIINPGSGKLGSPKSETKRQRFESPQRDTLINYQFEVSKYEVTFDDWEKCLKDGGCAGYKPDDNGWGRGKRPVINVGYDDAQKFISWLNGKTGETYRLLSEAEWEYVARAGQDAPFGNGFEMSAKMANFDGKTPYGTAEEGPYLRKTEPVGKYAPNAFGIHDMHGNVYEWVEDCWNEDHSGAVGDGSPRTDGDCKYRVMKGGSWAAHGYQTRAAARIRYVMDYRYDDYGLRLARTLN